VTTTAIYWANTGDATIRKLTRAADGGVAGNPATFISMATTSNPAASDIAVDTTILYALVGPSFGGQGCASVLTYSASSPVSATCQYPGVGGCQTAPARRFALDTANIYISMATCQSLSALFYSPKPGGTLVAYPAPASAATAMASDGATLYYATGAQIHAQPTGGGAASSFAASTSAVTDLAVDATSVYWIAVGGDVQSLAKASANGTPTTLASGQHQPLRLALDATALYWTNPGDGSIGTIPKAGGAARALVTAQASPWGIAVDALGVYWTNSGDGSVKMLPW
jgi:hypothetical protein